MSKQSEAKEKQHYVDKALQKRCGVCCHMTIRYRVDRHGYKCSSSFCGIGDFAVRPNGVCNLFERKD